MSAIDPVIQLSVRDWLTRIDSKLDDVLDRVSALEQQNKIRAGVLKAASCGLSATGALAGLIYTLTRLHG